MRRSFASLLLLLALGACGASGSVVEFWRPVSEPNVLLPLNRAQMKLDFDLSQCGCGIFPENIPQPELVAFQPDRGRFAETSVTRTADGRYQEDCKQNPSLVVGECMRTRGWELTRCSGRMPVAGGGALCAGYLTDSE